MTADHTQEITFKISPNVKRKNSTQYLALSTFPTDPKVPIDKASKGNVFKIERFYIINLFNFLFSLQLGKTGLEMNGQHSVFSRLQNITFPKQKHFNFLDQNLKKKLPKT